LRTGRLLIPYLMPGHYYGIEPQAWLIEEGIKYECGKDLIRIKSPVFSNDSNFTCTQFNRHFDYIYAHSVFTHASQHQIKRCLSEAKASMKPGSLFVATFAEGKDNYTGSNWTYPNYAMYTREWMTDVCGSFDMTCHFINWGHRNQSLMVITSELANVSIPEEIPTVERFKQLESNLLATRKRLLNLENHPYVKLGLFVKKQLRGCRRLLSNGQ